MPKRPSRRLFLRTGREVRRGGGSMARVLIRVVAAICLVVGAVAGCHRDQDQARQDEPAFVGSRWEDALDLLNNSDDPKARAAAARHLKGVHPRDLARLAPALKRAMAKEKDPDAKKAIREAYEAARKLTPRQRQRAG